MAPDLDPSVPAVGPTLQEWREAHAADVSGPAQVETPAAPVVPVVAPGPPPEHAWEDPDTGDRLDMRTRGGRRVKQLKGLVKSSETRIFELQEQLAAARAGTAPTGPAPVSQPPDLEPQLDQFAEKPDPYAAYTAALARWHARSETRAQDDRRADADRARSEVQQITAAQQTWDAQLPTVRQRYPDFDAAYDALAAAIPLDGRHRYLVSRILTVSHGPDLAHFLGTHPEELTRLFAVPSLEDHVRAIGHLEARVEAALATRGAAPVSPHTPPPPPMSPVGGTAAPTTYDPASASLAQFRQKHGVLGGRRVRA